MKKVELSFKDIKGIADLMIDQMVDVYGIKETIEFFLESGYTPDEVFSLSFDEESIQEVIDENKINERLETV